MDIIVLKKTVTEDELNKIVDKLAKKGLKANISKGTERTIIGVIGDTSKITEEESDSVKAMNGVESLRRIIKPYKLASREIVKENTVINIRGKLMGGNQIARIAGPCPVEKKKMLLEIPLEVHKAWGNVYRGVAF
ncbi:MAG: 3-deoxy-7-phosphoheptulonate synthase, partial [Nitrospirae bacterium]|nr:3-deoxy-7-phosphoheptulonate synthase [Nitrospirota bacterium]